MAASGISLLRALLVGTALSSAVPALAETTWGDLGTITLLGTGLPTDVLTNPASISITSMTDGSRSKVEMAGPSAVRSIRAPRLLVSCLSCKPAISSPFSRGPDQTPRMGMTKRSATGGRATVLRA